MNEQCWFIYGFRRENTWYGFLRHHSVGGPASVNFNWKKAANPLIIGFFHSHPSGMINPSNRDDRTMGAWVRSEGRSLICGIFSDDEKAAYLYYKGLNGITYTYLDVKLIGNIFIGKWG